MIETTLELAALKSRQRTAWSTGNYAVVGTTLQIVGEQLCEALDLRAGSRVLDVAAGNGNATLAAARRFCDVVSTDYVPALLEQGWKRAQAEGLSVCFQEADAEDLPFPASSFDVVLSTFGVMFTPDQARAASELLRVTRPGGRIGLANWTPASFVGQMFRTIGRYVPPQPGVKPPAAWGTRERVDELFGCAATVLQATTRSFDFRYRSPEHFLEVFRSFYGPMAKTYAALDPERQAALTCDLLDLLERGNRSGDGTLVLPSEYLEVVLQKND
jgi:ubiquinone/menaquinone biosynthesis C-methylase UbiE